MWPLTQRHRERMYYILCHPLSHPSPSSPSPPAGKPDDAYFKADVSVCGFSYVSEPTKWRCTNAPTPDDAWLSADFDDSAWAPAAVKVRIYHYV
jgi:hypothetical protein